MFYFFVCLFVCFKINLFLLFFSPSRETLETKLVLLKVSFATQSKYVTSEILVQLRSPKASSVNAYNCEHATLLCFDDVHLFPQIPVSFFDSTSGKGLGNRIGSVWLPSFRL